MFDWLTKQRREGDRKADSAPPSTQLFERLKRIAAEHMPDPDAAVRPPPPVTIAGLLPPPDYRRELIGRYDRMRRTMFPFNEQLWDYRTVR